MLKCEGCHKVLGVIRESSELQVRGEVTLVLFCQTCQHTNVQPLYEYNKKTISKTEVK
jgi:hypothetical protein